MNAPGIREILEGEWIVEFVLHSVDEMLLIDNEAHGYAAARLDDEVLDRWNGEVEDFCRGMTRFIEERENRGKIDVRLLAAKERLRNVLKGCEEWRNWKPPV